MDTRDYAVVIVTVVIALVLAGATLPVFAETTSATDTFTNNGYYRMEKVDNTTVIIWDPENPLNFNVDGVDYSIPSSVIPSYQSRTVIFSESNLIRIFNNVTSYNLQVWAGSLVTSSATSGITTITIDQDSINWLSGSANNEYSYTTDAYAINPNGSSIMKNATESAYIIGDSTIILGAGISAVSSGSYRGLYLIGTMDNMTVTQMPGTGTPATISNIAVVTSAVDGYNDLYLFDKITFDTVVSDSTVNQTYSYVVVPYEVDAEKSVHPDGALSVILNILPLLAIAGLVVGAVTWFLVVRKG